MTEKELKAIEVMHKGATTISDPCRHKGCHSHLTHPCEGCGRVAGQPSRHELIMCVQKIPALIQAIRERDKKIIQLEELLDVARCPNCDGSGGYMVHDGSDCGQAVQCQWCHMTKNALKIK